MNATETTPRSADPAFPPWQAAQAGDSVAAACGAWLAQLQAELPQARRCLVLLRLEPHALQLAALWPAGAPLDDLQPLLAQAAASPQPRCFCTGPGWLLTQPLDGEEGMAALVAVELPDAAAAQQALQRLAWGSGWMLALAARLAQRRQRDALDAAQSLLQAIAATTATAPGFAPACQALINRLALDWHADAVLAGWIENLNTRVVARSNATQNDARANLLNLAAAAMDEALDLRRTLHLDTALSAGSVLLPAHQAYAREAGCRAVASALLYHEGVAVGVLTLERGTPFSDAELETLETQCALLAPLLAQRREADRSLWQHARERLRRWPQRLGGESGLGWKAVSAAAALALLAAALVPVPFRVTAPSVVEGEVQRSLAAPFQGFVQQASLRAGDVVRAGQVIATLDDRELKLEAVKWQAELEVALRKEREAMAAGNRVELRQAAAQADQARAQLGLAEEKLRRARLTAPFDGVLVRGDLSQQLGSPVELGQVLFELAPLDAWRVILKVDERDIAHVQPQQRGELVLAGLSGERQPFVVKRVTAVATAEEGKNHFRVEAELQRRDLPLRPGMEGVAKIETGQAGALWVATRRLLGWARLALWEWLP